MCNNVALSGKARCSKCTAKTGDDGVVVYTCNSTKKFVYQRGCSDDRDDLDRSLCGVDDVCVLSYPKNDKAKK